MNQQMLGIDGFCKNWEAATTGHFTRQRIIRTGDNDYRKALLISFLKLCGSLRTVQAILKIEVANRYIRREPFGVQTLPNGLQIGASYHSVTTVTKEQSQSPRTCRVVVQDHRCGSFSLVHGPAYEFETAD